MTHLRWLALSMLIASGLSLAQMPSTEEMARATAATEGQARQAGVALRSGTLWLAALRDRAPLVAAYGGGVCQLGYSAYTPGRDYRWMFPSLSAEQRALWLAGVVHHELAHCVDQAAASTPAGSEHALAEGAPGQRWGEVLADLAFALHVDQPGSQGDRLVHLMAGLRARQGALDPSHDSSAELLCYLRESRTVRTGRPLAGPAAGLAPALLAGLVAVGTAPCRARAGAVTRRGQARQLRPARPSRWPGAGSGRARPTHRAAPPRRCLRAPSR